MRTSFGSDFPDYEPPEYFVDYGKSYWKFVSTSKHMIYQEEDIANER